MYDLVKPKESSGPQKKFQGNGQLAEEEKKK